MATPGEANMRAMSASNVPRVVTAGKTSAVYQVHSYPTKIPPEAIAPFIEAFTEPGATVLDPFCGSGMTGVAAIEMGRSAVLSDLSPGAVHLAHNHTTRVPPSLLRDALQEFDSAWMLRRERELYSARCPTCSGPGIARHTVWSEVVKCPACSHDHVLWDLREERGQVPRTLECERCGAAVGRGGVAFQGSVPVRVSVACMSGCAALQTGELDPQDLKELLDLDQRRVRHWMPSTPIEADREMYQRSALHLKGIETVADFFLSRAKLALSGLWHRIGQTPPEVRSALQFAFTNTAWHSSRMRRYNEQGGQRPLTGTLYIPQLVAESNPFEIFRHQVAQICKFYDGFTALADASATVRRSSAADLSWLPDDSVDYVFTDPPFGGNIFYADCNIVWESWLGEVTNVDEEMVVNRCRSRQAGGKTTEDYGHLLRQSFAEIRRVLKPTGRASIVFHNSDDHVWAALLRAAEDAGLHQTEVSILDKVQRSMKGYRGRSGRELVPFFDLVITMAPGSVRSPQLNGVGEMAMAATHQHLTESGISGKRSLEYLYSVALAEIVRTGSRPEGLSLRAFERLCNDHFDRDAHGYRLS
jgi:DNA modification methylase